MPEDFGRSIGDDATLAGAAKCPPSSEASLGDERTLGGGNAGGLDTVIDDIEVVDLESRYQIEDTLGQGGMGAVLLATDTRLDRKVAIKRILGESARSKAAIARFLTEAKSIAALNHPNIVQIYDYGRAKDGPFLIMEFVDGGSLLDRCRESALPLDEAIDLACQLCDGLAKAHDLGIIHRDIKPANVLLTKDGIPKLTDFGLAKAQASDHGQTTTGAVLGTPDFMPPEQRRDAAEVDHRSDLWSLAATIYQMVTGRSPKIIRFKDVPESLQDFLGKALEDVKDSRYQTARELRDALKSVSDGGNKSSSGKPAGAGELQEGRCKFCGTITIDLTRRFCRNSQCGASLRVVCLKCDAQIPVWDGVCGECGGNQPTLIDARCQALAIEQAKAEELAASLAFGEAVECATKIASESRPEFATFAAWAQSFLDSTTKEWNRLQAVASQTFDDARRHAVAHDYPSAIHTLERIPKPLRDASASSLLLECQSRQAEAAQLITEIADRIKRKELKGLVPMVERAVAICGDRKDLPKLLMQLTERERKIAGTKQQRSEWIMATFEKALCVFREEGDAKTALEIVMPIEKFLPSHLKDHITSMQMALEAEARFEQLLARTDLRTSIAIDDIVPLAHSLGVCLKLLPKNPRLLRFRTMVLERVTKDSQAFISHIARLRPFLDSLDRQTQASLPADIRSFLQGADLVPCPKCGAAVKPSRMQSHLGKKCRGRKGRRGWFGAWFGS